jgi:hypothetical protein
MAADAQLADDLWTAWDEIQRDRLWTMNAARRERVDRLKYLHLLGSAMPCHDRPMRFALLSGAYSRSDGAIVRPHEMFAYRDALRRDVPDDERAPGTSS